MSQLGEWVDCDWCGGEGVSGHDCGEDSCCCAHPEDDVICSQCDGRGGWHDIEPEDRGAHHG